MKGVKFFKTVQLKLIIIYVLLILFAMQLIGVYFVNALESSFTKNFSDSMNNDAMLLAQYVSEKNLSTDPDARPEDMKKSREDLDKLVKDWFQINNSEMQILNANGEVISMSQPDPAILGQKNTQQVVTRALQLQNNKETERNITDVDGLRKKMLARPVMKDGKVIGAVYIVKSMEDLYANIARINQIFITGTLIALALTALLGTILSGTITSPIKEITKQATMVAEGDFERRVRVYGQDEIGQLSNAFNNMTARLKEALAINEEEKEKLTSILTNMNDGVLATDERGRVIVMNPRAKEMLGADEQVAIGMDLFTLLGIPQEPELLQAQDSVQVKLIAIPDSREEDEELQVRLSVTSIHRREKGISGNIVVLQDVTEQEKLEWSRREFVANVSHELRTPLTTIKSYLEALEDGALEEPELAKRFVGVTRNESERMIRLVTDLLHLSRLDSKEAGLKKRMTDVGEMLEDVADRFSFQLRQRHIGIGIHVEPAVGQVLLDRDQIDQVLDNLVSNSIKYTGDGGHLAIRARLKDNGSQLEIEVEDNGIGIPKKDLSRIFDRFYRVDKARSRNMGGTGLGLSIAREIVKAHGGSITLDSELNQGTKVAFTLPVKHEESGGGE
ncbi:cell wall metabolism sensor histidine kinase WalK [Paenibacillus mesotrionivorans]|uniref:Cell wall metabolism sensor histidine kinase WalK n=1 Tax=Paenibacillus mesotrionivorans TaxID=3160968 RepID=A0ACC7P2U0_9BACL